MKTTNKLEKELFTDPLLCLALRWLLPHTFSFKPHKYFLRCVSPSMKATHLPKHPSGGRDLTQTASPLLLYRLEQRGYAALTIPESNKGKLIVHASCSPWIGQGCSLYHLQVGMSAGPRLKEAPLPRAKMGEGI